MRGYAVPVIAAIGLISAIGSAAAQIGKSRAVTNDHRVYVAEFPTREKIDKPEMKVRKKKAKSKAGTCPLGTCWSRTLKKCIPCPTG